MILRNKDLQTLQEIFQSVNMPLEVWAYGSRANGSAHEGSDLDLVIRGENLAKIDSDVLLELKEKIQDSNIPILVELLDWARLPASFHENIKKKYQVIFQSSLITTNAV